MEFDADLFGLEMSIRFSLLKSFELYQDSYFTKYMLFGPLFALAILSLFGDTESDRHPSPSARRDNLLNNFLREIQNILGNRFDDFLKWIDNDLLDIMMNNSINLFILFEHYRELMNKFIEVEIPNRSWIDVELEKNTKKFLTSKD
jgi:hypothetical protein